MDLFVGLAASHVEPIFQKFCDAANVRFQVWR